MRVGAQRGKGVTMYLNESYGSEVVVCHALALAVMGEHRDRIAKIIENWGDHCLEPIGTLLGWAINQDKLVPVMEALERWYETHLFTQHPDIRGTVTDNFLGVNPTKAELARIARDILGRELA